jgi:hypothetical protein
MDFQVEILMTTYNLKQQPIWFNIGEYYTNLCFQIGILLALTR